MKKRTFQAIRFSLATVLVSILFSCGGSIDKGIMDLKYSDVTISNTEIANLKIIKKEKKDGVEIYN
ncbi:hypothetical protein ACFLZG_08130 [Thermodesulfobacteriota bacterium]